MKLFFNIFSITFASQGVFASSICDQLPDLKQRQTCKKYLENGYSAESSNGFLHFSKKNNLTISSKIKAADPAQPSVGNPNPETLIKPALPTPLQEDQKKQDPTTQSPQKTAEPTPVQKPLEEKVTAAPEPQNKVDPTVKKDEKKDPNIVDQAKQAVKQGVGSLLSDLSDSLKQK